MARTAAPDQEDGDNYEKDDGGYDKDRSGYGEKDRSYEPRPSRASMTRNIVQYDDDGSQVHQKIAIEAPALATADVPFPEGGRAQFLQHSVPHTVAQAQRTSSLMQPAPSIPPGAAGADLIRVNRLGSAPSLDNVGSQQADNFTRHHKLINRAEMKHTDGSDSESAADAIEALNQPVEATPETLGDVAFDLGVQHSKLNQHQMAALYYIKARCSFMVQDPADQGAELEAVFNIAASHMMMDDPQQTLLTLQPSLLVLDDRERAMAAVGGGVLGTCQSTVALCEAMAAHACVRLNKLEEALVYFQRAYARISRIETDMPVNLGSKLSQDIGALLNMLGRFQEAVAWHVQAINMFEQDGEDEHKAHCLDNLGFCQAQIGDYNQAKQAFDMAIELWRAHNNLTRLAGTLERLGTLMFILDELGHALYFFQQSVKVAESCGIELPFLGAAEKCDYIYAKMNNIPLYAPPTEAVYTIEQHDEPGPDEHYVPPNDQYQEPIASSSISAVRFYVAWQALECTCDCPCTCHVPIKPCW